jgi:hypothetical protein
MAAEGKADSAATAAFAFALLYAGSTLLVQLPILMSRALPPSAQREAAMRTGAIVGLAVECALIAALGFGILRKRVWAAWLLFAITAIELTISLLRGDIKNAILPLILLVLVLWAITSLRTQKNAERAN